MKAELKRAEKILEGIALPSRPTVMLEVIKAQNAFAPDPRKVTEIIRRDLVLASEILREANTELNGFNRKVATIEQAVLLLGIERVHKVVSRLFLSTTLIGKDGPLQDIRLHAVNTGLASAYLAEALLGVSPVCKSGFLPAIPPEEAYVLGLFHDCGLAIFMQKFADYGAFHKEVKKSGETRLIQAEEERYRTNHCLVGYQLCESWQLPEHLCQVVRVHHQARTFTKAGSKVKNRRAATLQGILNIAEGICDQFSSQEWNHLQGEVLSFFDIGEGDLAALQDGARAVIRSSLEAH
ncbi:MAG: HDOD domain-containing protein [Magnetococcales bacterium]|nr:HDOD domain-containing protein [Magnetococcales bacterium]